jgi:hypothetical protein
MTGGIIMKGGIIVKGCIIMKGRINMTVPPTRAPENAVEVTECRRN